ncbi:MULTISPECIES: class I SAM-dependent methyltransferase [unclassified Bradyrhizobium]|uniref:class I SAM-dependent methyltransferase n=1 Tax=unclassified Bradyrhizobium TaxID=2631580 RepID=UPI00102E975C|nr:MULTISPECIES: class I SAM-dependent methyltransferase [unclassified Bradyrhizobium]MDI4238394.1 class I SAM-dependent methyltransferase [Bradyrhizobium sp. Arg237L]TAI62442.1 SAM-dependent methyltransferase [Bradyrhizobium sp. Leo170]
MAQNIYDDPVFFAGYTTLPRSVRGPDGAPEWPAVRAQLPDLAGKRVLDLGCGFGWFARWARAQGAAHVLGLDLSENMIGRARLATHDAGIEYRIADLERVEFPPSSVDLAYSSLALHYIEDFERLVRSVYHALGPGGRFVFTIEHPIYMASSNPGWRTDQEGRKTWPVDAYALEGPRKTNWFADGVIKYHRRIGTTLNMLIGVGFEVRHVEEFAPTPDQIAAMRDLAEELERPMMLIVTAQRQAR